MASFGEMLRRERKLRRISLREISEATKINIRYLEALERNEFEYLPGGAFTRGFIRAYARCIGVDDGKMIDAYEFELQEQSRRDGRNRDEGGPGLDALARRFEETSPEELRRLRARRLVVAAGLLILLSLIAGGIWAGRHYLRGDAPHRPAALESVRP